MRRSHHKEANGAESSFTESSATHNSPTTKEEEMKRKAGNIQGQADGQSLEGVAETGAVQLRPAGSKASSVQEDKSVIPN